MHAENLFRSQIAKIRRRNVIQMLHEMLLNASLIYLSFNLLSIGLQTAGLTSRMADGWWHAVSGGISLLLGVATGLTLKRKFPQVLIEIDRRLALQDKLSTAHEYFKYQADNVFTGLLVRDATSSLQAFNMQQIMPITLSRRHWAAAALLLLNVFLYSEAWDPTGKHLSDREIINIEKAGKLLKDYSIRRIDNRKSQSQTSKSKVDKKLNQVRQSLQDRSKTFDQQVRAMHQYREEIQGERSSLTNELDKRLEAAAIKPLLTPTITPSKNLSAAQLEKLRKFLSETFNNRIPDSINRDIETLQELYRLEDLVSRIIKSFEEVRTTAGISTDASENEKQDSQSAESDPSQPDNRNNKKADRRHSDRNPMAAGSFGYPDSRKTEQNDSGPGGDPNQADTYSATAGKGTSDTRKESDDDLQKAGGMSARDKVAAALSKNYLIQIRALTEIGDAQLPADEIFISYRKEVESVLQKEDIPPNYRKYIKNYFHSIGIKAEKEAHESR